MRRGYFTYGCRKESLCPHARPMLEMTREQQAQQAQSQCLAMMQSAGITNAFAQSAALASIANMYAQNPYVQTSTEPDEGSDEVRSKLNGCEVPKWGKK